MPTANGSSAPFTQGRSYADGRDELHLADFPISVLRRRQPVDGGGRKLDRLVYESTAYDPVARRRSPQRVTLTTSAHVGLPTPADEAVLLALLHTAKWSNDFRQARVHFSPHQLFRVMRWAPNGRSYQRLARVLLRLKSLTVHYENAWWDIAGRKYRGEKATGIVAEYQLVASKVRRKADTLPPSYVHWTPEFAESLAGGNLKRLDLDRLFALHSPIARRMYRYLDKRFYLNPTLEIDLRDFACGHLGVTATPNVAELKRRLAPALAELEATGFLAPADPEGRFLKVRAGVWRVRLTRAAAATATSEPQTPTTAEKPTAAADRAAAGAAPPRPIPPGPSPVRAAGPRSPAVASRPTPRGPEVDLVRAFYREWSPGVRAEPTEQELAQARGLIAEHGEGLTSSLVPAAVALLRAKFPEARRFGASLSYFAGAARAEQARRRRREADDESARRRAEDRREADRRHAEADAFAIRWAPRWQALAPASRDAVLAAVLRTHPYLDRPPLRESRVVTQLALEEFARRSAGSPPDVDA